MMNEGPRSYFFHISKKERIFTYSLSMVVSLIALTTNILIILTILKSRKVRRANFSWVLANLAAADALNGFVYLYLAVGNITQMALYGAVAIPRKDCLSFTFPQMTSLQIATIFTVAVAIERFVAIYAFGWYRVNSEKIERVLSIVPWVFGFVSTPFMFLNVDTTHSVYPCSSMGALEKEYLQFLFILFITTLVMVTFIYSAVIIVICHRKRSHGVRINRAAQALIARQSRINEVVALVIICFLVTWGVLLSVASYALYGKVDPAERARVMRIVGDLPLVNSSLNFFLYIWKSSEFREAFRAVTEGRDEGSGGSSFILLPLSSFRSATFRRLTRSSSEGSNLTGTVSIS